MAMKRGGTELTHDNWDQEPEAEEAGTFKKASEGQMQGRVIKKARRRNAGGAESETKNAFSGFSGFSSQTDSSQAFSFLSKTTDNDKASSGGFAFGASKVESSATSQSGFSFLSSAADKEKPSAPAVGGFAFGASSNPSAPDKEKPPPTMGGFAFGASSNPTQPSNTTLSSGFSFGSQTASSMNKPTFGSLSSDCKADAPVFGAFGSEKAKSPPAPAFGSKPEASNTFGAFAFGSKKEEIEKEAAESSIAKSEENISKPSFGNSGSFKFGSDTSKVEPGFKVSEGMGKNTQNPDASSSSNNGGFKFGAIDSSTKVETPASNLFSFGSTDKKQEAVKPKNETFGSKVAEETPSSLFSFGKKTTDEKQDSTAAFSFGANKTVEPLSKTSSQFTFGKQTENTKESVNNDKPAFGSVAFGAKSDLNSPTKDSFSFGSKTISPSLAVPPSSNAGDIQSSNTSGPKASLIDKEEKEDSKMSEDYLSHLKALNLQVLAWLKQHIEANPLIILSPVFTDYDQHLSEITQKFGKESKVEKAPESMNKAPDLPLKPISVPSSNQPTPSANAGKVESSATSFSFGSSSKPSLPASPFSFGQTTQPSTTNSTPFSFGQTNTSSSSSTGFSFGQGSTTNSTECKDDDRKEEEEDQPPVVEVKQVEENDAIYDKKCKLFYKKDGNYVEKGVGMLYLKKVDGGRTQLLIRADTNLGNVLLNILLSPQIPTTRVGKNNVMLICVPHPPIDPKSESSEPCSMLIRVKTADDADELRSKLDDLKGKETDE